MLLPERLLCLVRPLIVPDLVRDGIDRQTLRDSFSCKAKNIYSTFSKLPEAQSRDSSIKFIEFSLRDIDWNRIDGRFLRMLETVSFGYPLQLPEAKVKIVVGCQQETGSTWLSLAFGHKEFQDPISGLSFSATPLSLFASFAGLDSGVCLTNDTLALLEGKKPNKKTFLEIANLTADFVQQVLNGSISSKLALTVPYPGGNGSRDRFSGRGF